MGFASRQKQILVDDLTNLVTPEQRRVLEECLWQPIPVFCEGREERIGTPDSTMQFQRPMIVRPSPARHVVVSEPPRRVSGRVQVDNHRFSRGLDHNRERAKSVRDLGEIKAPRPLRSSRYKDSERLRSASSQELGGIRVQRHVSVQSHERAVSGDLADRASMKATSWHAALSR
jgi:hypothetical protein